MISNKRIFYYLFFVFLTTTILLAGCASSTAQPRAPASMDKSKPVPMRYWAKSPPVKEKLPLRIGRHAAKRHLNISPQNMQAIGATFLANQMEPHSFMFTFTLSSVFKFSDVYSTLFQSTESVDRLPPGIIKGPPLDGIIEDQISFFDVRELPSRAKTVKAEITYRFTLYSPQGKKISSWTVKGEGEEAKRPGDPNFHVMRAIDEAMHDAATKFINGFSEVPAVKQLLQEKKGTANP